MERGVVAATPRDPSASIVTLGLTTRVSLSGDKGGDPGAVPACLGMGAIGKEAREPALTVDAGRFWW